MTTDPYPWALALQALQAQVWARLVRGVADWHASAHHTPLATASPDDAPAADLNARGS